MIGERRKGAVVTRFKVQSYHLHADTKMNYEGVSKSFRTESVTKYTLTFVITR
jgi:hypothetical protein